MSIQTVSAKLTEAGVKHVLVLARVKTTNEYTWLRFTGHNGKNLVHGNGKTTVKLESGDVYGVRLSSSGKQYRLVTQKTGLTKVFTVPESVYKNLLRAGKPVSKPKIDYKVAASRTVDPVAVLAKYSAMSRAFIGDDYNKAYAKAKEILAALDGVTGFNVDAEANKKLLLDVAGVPLTRIHHQFVLTSEALEEANQTPGVKTALKLIHEGPMKFLKGYSNPVALLRDLAVAVSTK